MTEKSLDQMRCFLLDMDGTFYLGEQLLNGALDFIATLRAQGKGFIFLTNNSSKNRQQYVEKITRLGLPIQADQVLTSGEATALYLLKTQPQARLYVVGTPGLEQEFRGRGFELTDANPDVVVLGFDTTLTYDKLWKLCDFVRAGLPYIATHGDLNCPTPTGYMPDIGSFIALVKTSTGREPDVIIGKPNRMIIDAAAAKVGCSLDELAMIGDRLYTDIALRQTAGIVTVLVLSGETSLADLADSPYQPSVTFKDLDAVGEWLREHPNHY
jgi:4-nitrophenyl phosphatase